LRDREVQVKLRNRQIEEQDQKERKAFLRWSGIGKDVTREARPTLDREKLEAVQAGGAAVRGSQVIMSPAVQLYLP
jgi:hypothetical protein